MRRRWGLVALIAVLLAACGGTGNGNGTGGGSTSADTADDQRLADAAVLTIDDLPSEFRENSKSSGSDSSTNASDPSSEAFADCLGFDPAEGEKAETAKAQRSFETQELSLQPEVQYYESDSVPKKILDVFKDDKAVDCFGNAMEDLAAASDSGFPISDVEVRDRPSVPDLGDQQVSFALEMKAGGIPIGLRFYVVRVGRVVVSVAVTQFGGSGGDDQQAADALQTMVDRLENT